MNRCRHDITNDILSALALNNMKITHLCSVGNVPVDRGKKIVKDLKRYGLLFEIEGTEEPEYRLTDKGYEWIGIYKLLTKRIP